MTVTFLGLNLAANFTVSDGGIQMFSAANTLPYGLVGDAPPPPATPLPAAFPLFATGLGAMGLLGWRRKRKNAAAIAAA